MRAGIVLFARTQCARVSAARPPRVERGPYRHRFERMPRTPFFRFPGFASSQALLDRLERRGIVVFGADLWASDWTPMSPPVELSLVLARVEANRGGIVLFHDTRAQTAAMLAAFLRALKSRSYRLVQVVAAAERYGGSSAGSWAPVSRRHRRHKSAPTAALKGSLNCRPLVFGSSVWIE